MFTEVDKKGLGSTIIGNSEQDIGSVQVQQQSQQQQQQDQGSSLQQLLQQREEESRQEIERLTAEIRALKLQLLQYSNGTGNIMGRKQERRISHPICSRGSEEALMNFGNTPFPRELN
ncbi:hypothetical protein JTB14_000749 [Gonioctena quinquepunctata]|nr:hypothetical protein JTB14_000749 [Gonioctena quinquepunctata]